MARRPGKKPVLIVTCGNPDAGDDGFGHAVAAALRAGPLPGATVAALGLRPAELLDYARGYAALIIVDAVSCPSEEPGALLDVDWFDPDRPVLISEREWSTHGISIGRQIALGQSLGMLPPAVRLIGVNIAQAEIGCAITEAIKICIPDAVRIIREHAIRLRKGER